MPDSPLRKSRFMEVDSEVIQLGAKQYLFTTDGFSKEDLFRENDPFILGWNIACASISDIIAAGGKPLIYSHSMVISKKWDEKYIEQFSKGISDVLKRYSISFSGGDLGISDDWSYIASVIGKPEGKILNRKGTKANDTIFITGKIGTGNLEAALNLYSQNKKIEIFLKTVKNKFRILNKIPEILFKYASTAIDTSDGAFAALQTLSEINQKGFYINNIPFISKGIVASKILNLPKLLLFFGECGEYEILFTVNEQNKNAFVEEFKINKLDLYEIGKINENYNNKSILFNGKHLNVSDYNLNARDFNNVKEYLKEMINWINLKDET